MSRGQIPIIIKIITISALVVITIYTLHVLRTYQQYDIVYLYYVGMYRLIYNDAYLTLLSPRGSVLRN